MVVSAHVQGADDGIMGGFLELFGLDRDGLICIERVVDSQDPI